MCHQPDHRMCRPSYRIVLAIVVLAAGMWAASWVASRPAVAQGTCTFSAQLREQAISPDLSPLAPGSAFTVTWTLRNDGACVWDDGVRLILASGERFGSARILRLPGPVAAGRQVTLTLALTVPDRAGSHRATWRLRDPNGQRFGPSLDIEIVAGTPPPAAGEIVLPEVLVFGGRGAGSSAMDNDPCVDDAGARLRRPGLVLDDSYLEYRRAILYLCGFPTGATVTLTLTNPLREEFGHRYTVPEAESFTDARNRSYTQTVVAVRLSWPERAASGEWRLRVSDSDTQATARLTVPPQEALSPSEPGPVPTLSHWPDSPVDPVMAARGCSYAYRTGQTLWLAGTDLPPATQLPVGLYQERLDEAYLLGTQSITTTADGSFLLRVQAPDRPGMYYLVAILRLADGGYMPGGEAYEVGYGEDTAVACLTVLPDEGTEPLRLVMVQGTPGASDLVVLDVLDGRAAYPTYNLERCDAGEPAWWPGGDYLVYHSNCVQGPPDSFGFPTLTAGSYDLYLIETFFPWEESEDAEAPEPLALTQTPEWDETDPHVDGDGWIVFRRAPAGTPLDQDAPLYVLDPFEDRLYELGEQGRAPVWSPDSSAIAFMSARSGRWQVYVLTLADGATTLVSTQCAGHCRFPAWSPDGTALLYSMTDTRQDLTPSGLWIADAAGTSRPVRWLSGAYGRPNWSATGWVAFNGVDGIYRAHMDDRPPKVERYLYSRPDLPPYWAPAWSR